MISMSISMQSWKLKNFKVHVMRSNDSICHRYTTLRKLWNSIVLLSEIERFRACKMAIYKSSLPVSTLPSRAACSCTSCRGDWPLCPRRQAAASLQTHADSVGPAPEPGRGGGGKHKAGHLRLAVLQCSSKSYFQANLTMKKVYLWARPIKITHPKSYTLNRNAMAFLQSWALPVFFNFFTN